MGSWLRLACGFRLKHDVVAERVEAADQSSGRAVLVDVVEVVAAEIGEDDAALEHMDDGNQDLVCPLRVPRRFCLPALSELAGQTPAHAVRRCAVPNTHMSTPISAMMEAAVISSTPGIVVRQACWAANGRMAALGEAVSAPISCWNTPKLWNGLKGLEQVGDAPQTAGEPDRQGVCQKPGAGGLLVWV